MMMAVKTTLSLIQPAIGMLSCQGSHDETVGLQAARDSQSRTKNSGRIEQDMGPAMMVGYHKHRTCQVIRLP